MRIPMSRTARFFTLAGVLLAIASAMLPLAAIRAQTGLGGIVPYEGVPGQQLPPGVKRAPVQPPRAGMGGMSGMTGMGGMAGMAGMTVVIPPEQVEADVSTRSVAVTSSFSGTEIIVFGTVQHSRQPTPESGYYDIAIVVDGTPTPLVARRKSNVAGIWLNAHSVRYDRVPSYYAIASTRPVEEIAEPRVLDQHRIGFGSVHMTLAADQPQLTPEERVEFREAVIRLKQKDKLYQTNESGVAFIGRSLFRSTIKLPANVPVGPLVAHTYLFRNGELLAKHSTKVTMQREGLESYLHSFAFDYPLLYGIAAVFIAVASGLIASAVFKKGSH